MNFTKILRIFLSADKLNRHSRSLVEYRSSRPAKSAHKVLSASQLDAPLQIMTRAPHWWRRHSMKSHECVKVLVRALERAAELLPGTSRAAVISTNDSH
jgi:hypothetical protein